MNASMTPTDTIAATSERSFMRKGYEIGYQLLSMSSDEENIIGDAILKNVPAISRLADVGCADARLAERLLQDCNDFVIVEPNPILFSLAVSRLQGRCRVTALNDVFPCDIGINDLIVFAHVLYHVDESQWIATFQQLRLGLAPGGVLAIALWNRDSEARQLALSHSGFDRWLCAFEDLERYGQALAEVGLVRCASDTLTPLIKPHSIPAAKAILEFLLGDGIQRVGHAIIERECRRLVETGLTNRQTLCFFRKAS